MKIMDWESVEESTPFEKLPAGGYVVRILDAEDHPRDQYVDVVFDIAEGPKKGFYDTDFGHRNPWSHSSRIYYKGKAVGMFKAFLKRLEETNPGFTVRGWQVECNEQDFVGLYLGAVLQYRRWTGNSGDDKESIEIVSTHSADDIRAGKYKVPPVVDKRTKDDEIAAADKRAESLTPAPAASVSAAPAAGVEVAVDDDDLPF